MRLYHNQSRSFWKPAIQQRTDRMFRVWIYRLVFYVPVTPYISMLLSFYLSLVYYRDAFAPQSSIQIILHLAPLSIQCPFLSIPELEHTSAS